MTKGQRIALQADWWPAAARAQGWPVADRKVRLRVCMWAVSLQNPSQLELLAAINSDRLPERWLDSTNDLDNGGDVDRVKACLGMLADRLKDTGEVGRPAFGSARRKRDLIRDHIKCLALFESHPRRLLAALVNDLFNHGRPGLTIRDLTDDAHPRANGTEGPSDLQRLLMRLAQIVNDRRRANVLVPAYKHLHGAEPLTIHEMKWTVGAFCDCKICSDMRAAHSPLLPPLPAPAAAENWTDFDPELESVTDEFGGASADEGGDPF